MAKRKQQVIEEVKVFKFGCWWNVSDLEKFESSLSPERKRALQAKADREAEAKRKWDAWWEKRANREGISLKEDSAEGEEIEIKVKEEMVKLG